MGQEPKRERTSDSDLPGSPNHPGYTQAGRAAFSGRMDIRVLSGVHCVACGILEANGVVERSRCWRSVLRKHSTLRIRALKQIGFASAPDPCEGVGSDPCHGQPKDS